MSMTELDADARQRGNAAIAALERGLESAESHARWAAQDVAAAERLLSAARAEAEEFRQALSKLRGGDSHGG